MEDTGSAARDIVICSSAHCVAVDAAHRFVAIAASAIRLRGRLTVALAGGKTPTLLYALLASTFPDAIDWGNVMIFFGDERCVPPDHEFSNYGAARHALIDPLGLSEANVNRIHGEDPDPDSAAERYAKSLAALPQQNGVPSFDLILLGMGPDGHCASLFPGKAALSETDRWAVSTPPGMQPEVTRVTLTMPVINAASNVIFTVTGADKAGTVTRVFDRASDDDLPSRSVRPSQGSLTWVLDRAAAAGI